MRVTTLLQTSSRLEVYIGSYAPSKSRGNPSYGNFKTLGIKNHLDVALWRGAKYTIKGKAMVSPKFGP
jgi:hypothetical protein